MNSISRSNTIRMKYSATNPLRGSKKQKQGRKEEKSIFKLVFVSWAGD